MDRAVHELDRASGRMAGDFRTMIADGEDLLKAVATVSGEGITAARTRFEERLKSARTALGEVSQPIFDRTRETAAITDRFVRGHAWTVIGIAVAAAALIGFLTAKPKR